MSDLNLLISQGGQILGQTFSVDNATRHKMVAKDLMYVASGPRSLEELPVETYREIADDLMTDDAPRMWRALKKNRYPYYGKISVQKVLRTMYASNGAAFTKEELLETVPGATWISITTAFSMLKNKKYAKGGILKIERNGDDKYARSKQ